MKNKAKQNSSDGAHILMRIQMTSIESFKVSNSGGYHEGKMKTKWQRNTLGGKRVDGTK